MKVTIAKFKSRLRITFISILAAFITACGGGAIITLVEGGISGTGISWGSILAFGSVIVNGTKLEINNQTGIYIDELPALETDLKVGYVIRVEADFDNNSASRIDYVETVRGPITTGPTINPDTLTGSFDVLGQTVITNSLTIFDGIADVTTLAITDVLEVSGVRDSSGAIIARYLQLKNPPALEYRVLGVIASMNATEFTIGNLVVDYTIADLGNLTGGIQVGTEVRVKGLATSFISGSLMASSVSDSVLQLGIQTGDSVELEGAVTRFQDLSDMDINGFPVNAINALIEEGDISDIILDALVEVEGSVDSANILNATKLKIIPLSNIRIRAPVNSVNAVNNSIVVLGQLFKLNEKTQLEDGSAARIAQFSLGDLSSGDWVKIRGYFRDGNYILTRLERDDPGTGLRLQAPVDGIETPPVSRPVSILGNTILTDINTVYEDKDDNVITEAQFFNMVAGGQLVKAKWSTADTSVPVDDLSFEE